MRTRILCLCLSFCLLLGALVTPVPARAASSMKASDDLLNMIKQYEGFSGTPYVDTDGKYTIGYGTRCPDELVEKYQKTPMTEKEAEAELRKEMVTYEDAVNAFMDKNGVSFKQHQFDAVCSLVFNVGNSWLNKGETLIKALTSGASGNDLIYAFTIYSMSGGKRSIGHVLRRLSESCIYNEGIYSRPAPDRYCYVLYDAQGGTISAMGGTYNVQGYNADLTTQPVATASKDGYAFKGWYTSASGGTKVTTLDKSHNALTLYAQWGAPSEVHNHSYTAKKIAPTCTAQGYTLHTCDCGDSYKDSYTDKTAHSYKDNVCTACGAVLKVDVPQIQYCYSQNRTSVRVQWTQVAGADGYQLYRATDPNASFTCIKTVTGGSTLSYTNQGLTEGVTYYYKVRSFTNVDGKRVYSKFSEVDHMPAAVVFDAPYSNSTSRIRLRWHEISGAHGYQIWRKEEGSEYKIIKTIGDKGNTLTTDQGGVTAYSNTDLTSGKKYTYRMRAFFITEDGKKVYGPYSQDILLAVLPETPEINGSNATPQQVKLHWDQIDGADGYQIWMTDALENPVKITKTVNSGDITSYIKHDLKPGNTYYFKMRAFVVVDGKQIFSGYSRMISLKVK